MRADHRINRRPDQPRAKILSDGAVSPHSRVGVHFEQPRIKLLVLRKSSQVSVSHSAVSRSAAFHSVVSHTAVSHFAVPH